MKPELEQAVDVLAAGGVICYPTETFYALGADPWNEPACGRIRMLKGRPDEKELPLILARGEMVSRFCDTADPRFVALTERFWPGPLTLVLRSLDGHSSYAVRVSSHPVAHQLSLLLDGPIVSTSANISGEAPAADPAQLPEVLKDGVDLLIDGGICAGGLPSTIVSLLTHPAVILREGAVPSDEVMAVL